MNTSHQLKHCFMGIFLLVMGLVVIRPSAFSQEKAKDVFKNPPLDAKPRGYWIWGHGNYDYGRIREELNAFKEMGLGGVDIFDMGIADPYDIIPEGNQFLGEAMLDGIEFAMREAKKLNLAMGFSVSNGWNAGGSWTHPDEMIMRLLFWRDTLTGPTTVTKIGFPEIPLTFEKPYGSFELFPQMDKNGLPIYYDDVALVAYPMRPDSLIKDPGQIIFFDTDEIDAKEVDIQLPKGKWILARAVVSPLGQKMWMRSDNTKGFIMDHYSKKATRHHFEHVIGKLEQRLGDLSRSALERLYLCSFEAEDYIIWSPELRNYFYQQHGYNIDSYIPVFDGQKIVDQETTKRFLHDYRSTVSEMFVNNHYRQARSICHDHGVLLASESGGPGPPLHYVPTEDLKALGAVDIMRGEFWNRKPKYFDKNGNDLVQVVRNIASAAHIYGHKIVEMESFSSHEKHWQETPLELKKIADNAFCEGMTRVVYHTMPHSPKEAGVPGWSYQAGTHISPKMTWWKLSKPFHDYIARTSALLQLGHFVADVAYYYGEQIPNFASGSKYIRKTLGKGYDYDDLNKEVLLQSSVNASGQLLLPSGMTYQLLVLPDDDQMSLEVLQKIESLLNDGATVLGKKPSEVPGLKNFEERNAALQRLAASLWGSRPGREKIEHGLGTIFHGYTEKETLMEKGIQPDCYWSHADSNLDYIHRQSEQEDVYFIRNKDSVSTSTRVSFRVKNSKPYQFDPQDGSIKSLPVYSLSENHTHIPLEFEPYGSIFIVFEKDIKPSRHIVSIYRQGQSILAGNNIVNPCSSLDTETCWYFEAPQSGEYILNYSDNTTDTISHPSSTKKIVMSNVWQVHFPHGWGFDPIQTFTELVDWREHVDPELAIFSGSATYKTSFFLQDTFLSGDESYQLDLGVVGEVAQVFLNGHEVGTKVFPPYTFCVDGLLREGENHISIEVANTWLNQLIGEAEKPYDKQRTRSNLSASKTDRSKRHWSNYEPKASGLMGPVIIKVTHRYPLGTGK